MRSKRPNTMARNRRREMAKTKTAVSVENPLKELAKKVIQNEVYMAATNESIENSFQMLLLFGAEFPEDTVALYEDFDKAMPRAINGYPMFSSCKYLSKSEFEEFLEYYNQFKEALEI